MDKRWEIYEKDIQFIQKYTNKYSNFNFNNFLFLFLYGKSRKRVIH